MIGALVLGAGVLFAAAAEGLAYGMVTTGNGLVGLVYLLLLGAFANLLVWVGAELLRANR